MQRILSLIKKSLVNRKLQKLTKTRTHSTDQALKMNFNRSFIKRDDKGAMEISHKNDFDDRTKTDQSLMSRTTRNLFTRTHQGKIDCVNIANDDA